MSRESEQEIRLRHAENGANLAAHRPERRKLEVIIGDFCKTELPYFDVCISNTPYQVSPDIKSVTSPPLN